MGPPAAKEALKDAIAKGADSGSCLVIGSLPVQIPWPHPTLLHRLLESWEMLPYHLWWGRDGDTAQVGLV